MKLISRSESPLQQTPFIIGQGSSVVYLGVATRTDRQIAGRDRQGSRHAEDVIVSRHVHTKLVAHVVNRGVENLSYLGDRCRKGNVKLISRNEITRQQTPRIIGQGSSVVYLGVATCRQGHSDLQHTKHSVHVLNVIVFAYVNFIFVTDHHKEGVFHLAYVRQYHRMLNKIAMFLCQRAVHQLIIFGIQRRTVIDLFESLGFEYDGSRNHRQLSENFLNQIVLRNVRSLTVPDTVPNGILRRTALGLRARDLHDKLVPLCWLSL